MSQFSTDTAALARDVRALVYADIRAGSTDHPQVYLTAAEALGKEADGKMKLLILITDGVTHHGKDCGKLESSTVQAKIGVCSSSNGHICSPGCVMDKCMCGAYTAQLFKDKGYHLVVVGIANMHHVGETEAGVFQKQMTAMASPNGFFYAADFADLATIKPKLLAYMQ